MNFISVRIITDNVKGLVEFYEEVTAIPAVHYTPDFAELKSRSATLAIASTNTLQLFGGKEVAKAAQNHTAIIEFRVDDVERDYQRLRGLLQTCLIQEPTTMPWGNKSLLFRDPDGNLVNLFTPVTAQAIEKFDGNN